MNKWMVVLCLLIACALPGAAEEPAAVLQRALKAVGIRDGAAVPAVTEFHAEGTYVALEQARRPADEVAEALRSYRYVVDRARTRLRREADLVYPGGIRFSNLGVVDGAGGFQVDLLKWRQGTDLRTLDAKEAAATWGAASRFLPHLALLQARAGEALATIEGGLTYRDADGTAVALHFDDAHRLVKIVARPATGPATETTFAGYEPRGPILVPRRIAVRAGDRLLEEVRVTRAELRAAADDAEFAVPPGYVAPPPPGAPTARPLGGGVYFLDGMPGGYHALFVDGADGVTVVEAPLSPEYAEKTLELIRRTLPGKTVRRVLVTHHHGDHTGGLAPFIREGAAIVVAEGAEVAIRRQLARRSAEIAEQAVFEPVRTRTTFGSRVEAIPIATAHADRSLLVYIPAQRILFQGDLFYVPERGDVPRAFPVTRELARAIREHALQPRTIAGVHGRLATPAEMERALRVDAPGTARLLELAKQTGSDALYVSVDGEPVVDWARGEREPVELMSALKSLVAIAVGRLLYDGNLKSLDEPVHAFYPEWKQGRKQAITVRHLLNHTSGLQNVQNAGMEIYPAPDAIQLALAAELTSDPGAEFTYNNKAVNLLAGIIEKASGLRMDLYMAEKLFAPLGITAHQWYFDRSGKPHAMAGLRLRAADAAKFGQLVLDGGTFGTRRLVSSDYIAEMLAPGSDENARAGLLWWRHAGGRAFYAEGFLGQFIVVVPEAKVVAVRQIASRPGLDGTTTFSEFPGEVVRFALGR